MNNPAFTILNYSDQNLLEALGNDLLNPGTLKEETHHYIYFKTYLGVNGLDAKTILIENRYLSKVFLSEFAGFYAYGVRDYDRWCKRVHFFADDFNEKEFDRSLLYDTDEDLWNSYLGYIIIKPTVESIIGATILKPYSQIPKNIQNDKEEIDFIRYFNSVIEYRVTLFGKKIKIKSLAFQSQDRVLASCASTALWSAFHKLAEMFEKSLPLPYEITQRALTNLPSLARTYPATGLQVEEIRNVIESAGLDTVIINDTTWMSRNSGILRALIYSYNKVGLPVLMGVKINDEDAEERHLITITGYCVKQNVEYTHKKDMTVFGSSVEKFYAHDDTVGPFSRLTIKEEGIVETAWRLDLKDPKKKRHQGEINCIIIPVHPLIKIHFEDVIAKVKMFDWLLYTSGFSLDKNEIVWDIYLERNNNYKEEIRKKKSLPERELKQLLFRTLPEFLWVARARIRGVEFFDILFDTTTVPSGFYILGFYVFHDDAKSTLKKLFIENKSYLLDNMKIGAVMYEQFINSVQDQYRLQKNPFEVK